MSLFRLPGRKPSQQPRERIPRNREPVRSPDLVRAGQNRTFSYSANRSMSEFNTGREAAQNKPPLRRLPSRLQRLRRHFGWLLVGVLAVGLIAYELQLSTVPKVVSLVQVADAPYLQADKVYADKAADLFNSSAANRNKLTVDASGIAAKLKKDFPELQDVSVSLPLIGDQPTVYIRPADPVLALASGGRTYIVDENGRALAEASTATSFSRLNIPTVTDQSGLDVKLGNQVLPKSATDFISTIMTQLKAQHVTVQSLTLPAAASELNAYIEGQPYYVRFGMHDADTSAAALQAGTYVAVSKQLAKQGTKPSQYIDVRLAGRAYYK